MAGPTSAGPVADEENTPGLGAQPGSTSIALRHDSWRGFTFDYMAEPPPRHDTAEPPRDEAQEILWRLFQRTKNGPRPVNKRLLRRLQSQDVQYQLWKNRKPVELKSTGNIKRLSFDSLATHWVVAAPDSASTREDIDASKTTLYTSDTFSDWACRIAIKLTGKQPNTLQLITIAELPDPPYLNGLLCFEDKFWASLGGGLTRLPAVPTAIIKSIVCSAWEVLDETPSSKSIGFDSCDFTRPLPRAPPSYRHSGGGGDDAGSGLWSKWFDQNTLRGIEDIDYNEDIEDNEDSEDSEDNEIDWDAESDTATSNRRELTLSWLKPVTKFTSDLLVYISEPQRLTPNQEYAKITYIPSTSICEQARLLILFRGCHTVRNSSSMRARSRQQAQGGVNLPAGDSQNWSPEKEMIFSVLCVFSAMTFDVARFVRHCHAEIKAVHNAIRSSPSSSKMKFLLYLQDAVKMNLHGVDHGLEVLNSMESDSPSKSRNNEPPGEKQIHKQHGPSEDNEQTGDGQDYEPAGPRWTDAWISELRKSRIRDLEFQREQMLQLLDDMKADQELLRSRFQLVQDRRVFTLTIFAAIFLPLSFTTSIFGMNINTQTPEGPLGFSDWMKSTISRLPLKDRLATEILSSATATSGSLSFSWRTFGITAGSTILTLPISLIIGAALRVAVNGVVTSAAYWRPLFMLLYIFFFFAGLLGSVVAWWYPAGTNSFFMLTALYMVYLSRRTKNNLWHLWAVLVVSIIPSVVISVLSGITRYRHIMDSAYFVCILPWLLVLVYSLTPKDMIPRLRVAEGLSEPSQENLGSGGNNAS